MHITRYVSNYGTRAIASLSLCSLLIAGPAMTEVSSWVAIHPSRQRLVARVHTACGRTLKKEGRIACYAALFVLLNLGVRRAPRFEQSQPCCKLIISWHE